MKIVLGASAQRDLANIKEYFGNLSWTAWESVEKDISSALQLIEDFPDTGTLMTGKSVRRSVSSKHRFIIYHYRDGNVVRVVAVFRYQDR